MTSEQYDVVIIGTGAGGGTILSALAKTGKRILVLERGGFLPREKQNWSSREVFQKGRYHTDELWLDKEGKPLAPETGYWVGGNTKVYGAALFRFRERDFETVEHVGGSSPEWPLKYRDFEPWYQAAEELYEVHGQHGDDPTEPWRSAPYPRAPVSHEPRIQELHDKLVHDGLHPFYVPLGVRLDEQNRRDSPCIRCDTCDGYPCMVDAKSDADLTCVRPAAQRNNVELWTHAEVTRIVPSASGRAVQGVDVKIDGRSVHVRADLVVLAAGAINSAALLLRSASERHPHGLANGSGQVGRNFMKHHSGTMIAVSAVPNETRFQKTIALNDFYWGESDFPSPMGSIQLLGKVDRDALASGAPAIAPGAVLGAMATHSIDFWLSAEDLPFSDNRVRLDGERIVLEYHERNLAGFERLVERWKACLRRSDDASPWADRALHFSKTIPLASIGHQCGTCRFGDDPSSSVLDEMCRAHELDNLYVVDGSFFCSSAAVNPSLTIMANALRVGAHLSERLA